MHQKNKKKRDYDSVPNHLRAPRSRTSDDPISHEGPSLSVTSNAIIAHNFSLLPWSLPMFTLTRQARRAGSSDRVRSYTTQRIIYTYIYMCIWCTRIYTRDTRKNETRSERDRYSKDSRRESRSRRASTTNQYPRKLIAPGERVFRHSALARR